MRSTPIVPPLIRLLPLLFLPAAASAGILLNEVHLNVPGPDEDYEFVELRSTTGGVESCDGLTLLVINNDVIDADTAQPLNPGQIEDAIPLEGLSTGANGLLLLGKGYAGTPGGPWSGAIDPATATAWPPGMGNSDLKSNDGMTLLLVRNYLPPPVIDPLIPPDIDKDNDGKIDWLQAVPPAGSLTARWAPSDLMDSIGFRDRESAVGGVGTPYTSANVSAAPMSYFKDPDTMSRVLGVNTPNTASAAVWYGGKIASEIKDSTVYSRATSDRLGSFIGEVTPGRANLAASPALPTPTFVINEAGINPPGNSAESDSFQFVEILNTNTSGPRARSLAGYWLVLVDSEVQPGEEDAEVGVVGRVLEEWDLGAFATGSNGMLMIADKANPAFSAFRDYTDPLTSFADPSRRDEVLALGGSVLVEASTSLGAGNVQSNDGFTMYLIQNYKPSLVPLDIDSNDDGVMNAGSPLTAGGAVIKDQVGYHQAGQTGPGRTYSTVNLRTQMPTDMAAVNPDNLSRKAGDNRVNAGAWYGGIYAGDAQSLTVGFFNFTEPLGGTPAQQMWFGGFRASGTPGRANLSTALDPLNLPSPAAEILFSEVMADPTNDETSGLDGASEYIELISTTETISNLEGMWVVIVDLSPERRGQVVDGFPLEGYTTGLNGIALFGDNYDGAAIHPYIDTVGEGTLPADTAVLDPEVGLGGNDIPNEGFGLLLVRGVKGELTLNDRGQPQGDLDPDDDGILLAPSEYTDQLVDSICNSLVNPGPGYAWIDRAEIVAHNVSRYPRRFAANQASEWYAGQIQQRGTVEEPLQDPQVAYTDVWKGEFKGAASPGRMNHGAPVGSTEVGTVILNEVHFNPPGADGKYEFIELLDTGGARRSLNGYSIVAFDNDGPNTGSVESAYSLDGMTTGPNGYFVLGSGYDQPGGNPYAAIMRSGTAARGTPGRPGLRSTLNPGSLALGTDNRSITLLLVQRLTKPIGYDMDSFEGSSIGDSNAEIDGDGVPETVAWEGSLHDSVLLQNYVGQPVPPEEPRPYTPFDGFAYFGYANLTQEFFPRPSRYFFNVETIARFAGETQPNVASAWHGGALRGGADGRDPFDFSYRPVTGYPTDGGEFDPPDLGPPAGLSFPGYVTPGGPNPARGQTTDDDGDGVVGMLEEAEGGDPVNAASVPPPPAALTVQNGGSPYSAFQYHRLTGGAAGAPGSYLAGPFTYKVETSPDLTTWATPTDLVPVGVVPDANGFTEAVTVRAPAPLNGGRLFWRLRVDRQ